MKCTDENILNSEKTASYGTFITSHNGGAARMTPQNQNFKGHNSVTPQRIQTRSNTPPHPLRTLQTQAISGEPSLSILLIP